MCLLCPLPGSCIHLARVPGVWEGWDPSGGARAARACTTPGSGALAVPECVVLWVPGFRPHGWCHLTVPRAGGGHWAPESGLALWGVTDIPPRGYGWGCGSWKQCVLFAVCHCVVASAGQGPLWPHSVVTACTMGPSHSSVDPHSVGASVCVDRGLAPGSL